MAVFRIEKTRDYTVMSNYHLRDRSLSLKAKGLLSLMLSLPEDWDYTMKGLARICKDGIDSSSGGIRELEAHGYDQPPCQNETTDHTTDNKVQCKQGDPSTQGAAARHDPEAHPMEAKRQPAEYPEPYIVKLSVLHAGGFKDTIQDQRHGHGQYAFEEKCFDCFASCHR